MMAPSSPAGLRRASASSATGCTGWRQGKKSASSRTATRNEEAESFRLGAGAPADGAVPDHRADGRGGDFLPQPGARRGSGFHLQGHGGAHPVAGGDGTGGRAGSDRAHREKIAGNGLGGY